MPAVRTVLVVDDEFGSAEALSFILEDAGYRVFHASNGEQGLQQVAEIAPDLVILDFMMPIMNGAEMGRALRAKESTRGIKILMNSSLEEAAVRRHWDGYDAFLRKPFNFEVLLDLIQKLSGAEPQPDTANRR